ncbi:spike base protein, RCAP_Rcc01079 family [Pseudophaeobacter arcticus]|uniref:spike base protein, RCAP_Rcc01079 family n=1 Tax=Pseudophaeobacter arcticus TaxID=385492 RepID=UPI00333FA1DD
MSQIDLYCGKYGSITATAVQHFPIMPADGVDLPKRPRVLRVLTSGDVAIRDAKNDLQNMEGRDAPLSPLLSATADRLFRAGQ